MNGPEFKFDPSSLGKKDKEQMERFPEMVEKMEAIRHAEIRQGLQDIAKDEWYDSIAASPEEADLLRTINVLNVLIYNNKNEEGKESLQRALVLLEKKAEGIYERAGERSK